MKTEEIKTLSQKLEAAFLSISEAENALEFLDAGDCSVSLWITGKQEGDKGKLYQIPIPPAAAAAVLRAVLPDKKETVQAVIAEAQAAKDGFGAKEKAKEG